MGAPEVGGSVMLVLTVIDVLIRVVATLSKMYSRAEKNQAPMSSRSSR